jgi:hypothetical protein
MKKAFMAAAAFVALTGVAYAQSGPMGMSGFGGGGSHGGGDHGGGLTVGGLNVHAVGIGNGASSVGPGGGTIISPAVGIVDINAAKVGIGGDHDHHGDHGGPGWSGN